METTIALPLDYASPRIGAVRTGFRASLTLFAAGGIVANVGIIALLTEQLHRAQWVYHDLMQNPRAYGREIDPAAIAWLRDVWPIWTSFGAVAIACTFGLLLAVNLLIAAAMLNRNPPRSHHRLALYRRWKPLGVVLTVVALIWAGDINSGYWVAATRHVPIGSGGPPVVSTVVLLACGMLPWWWIGSADRPL